MRLVVQIREVVLLVLNLRADLLEPLVGEIILERRLIMSDADNSAVLVLMSFIVTGSHIAASAVPRVLISARHAEVDEFLSSKSAEFLIEVIV